MPTEIAFTTDNACLCCGEEATLECRIRGGTPALCGHSEYTSASTPPKKYRTETYSGSLANVARENADCTGNHRWCDNNEWSGTITYNSSTCGSTDTSNMAYSTTGCGSGGCSPVFSNNYNGKTEFEVYVGFIGSLVSRTTFTATAEVLTGTNTCQSSSVCAPGEGRKCTGTATRALTVEDTEVDAITRFQNATAWGSWQTVGGDCSNPDCCLANYEERTSGFTFDYQEAQFKVTATGLTPSTDYNALVFVWRRPFGSGSYELYQTLIIPTTTDGSGNLEVSDDVPNDIGFDTYVKEARVMEA